MADVTEAPGSRKGRLRAGLVPLALFAAAVLLSGCMRTSERARVDFAVDPATTASITPLSADADLLSDEAVIAGTIATADAARPLAWSNPDTGATGVIDRLVDAAEGETRCKAFTTSRHGFDGVALFKGRACLLGDGGWHVTNFARADG